MATRKNGNAAKAENDRAVKGDNSKAIAARLEESHVKMREFGVMAANGKSAKQKAVECYIADCVAGVAGPHMVDTYINWYDEGAKMSGSSRKSFSSQIRAFGNEKVIAAYPKFSAALTALHTAKDKAVSRKETDKDKFSQLYGIATRIASEGAPVKMNDDYIKATVAKKQKSSDELAEIAKEAIKDNAQKLLGDKPSKALLAARDAFFKLLEIKLA
jgi:hypothetical protein